MESGICTFAKSTKDLKKMHWFNLTFWFYFSIASSTSDEKLIPSKIPVPWSPQKKKKDGHRASIKGEKKKNKEAKKMHQKEKLF